MSRRWLSAALFALSLVVGVVALAFPFLRRSGAALPADQTPLLSVVLVSLCLAVLLVELQGQAAGAKTVAALGILVAAAATLRFIEVAIPGPGGFSPIFAPIILGGYVFGPRFGFLLGAMTLLVSGIITAGVGPWLPYQMFTAGWVGLSAGWLPHLKRPRAEVAMLVVFGALWGFLFGAIVNLTAWPLLAGDPGAVVDAGGGGGRRPAALYRPLSLATSLLWDTVAAAGNAVLLAGLGRPTLRALARFRDRLQFEVRPA